MSNSKKIIAGIWDSEAGLIEAAKKAKAQGFDKLEAISPYPLHGIDEILEIPRSFIPYITFVMGLLGCAVGTWFTWYVAAYDWPLNIGGKPMWSLAAFIPVIFELTILFAALSSVGAMIVLNGLPKNNPPIIHPDLTSHLFALFVPEDDKNFNAEKIESLFKELGAQEVKHSEF
ncbi:MAG: DUF3341 domain-containing protein [Bdellovibrionaceae bacterium]|nr:DUF3341 domain-containing protein [Pseudobdellovibrionaceae bacterium]